jgi:penicillin-binding protein 2
VNECELVRQNPARSWAIGLLDSLGHAVECGLIQKEINPYQLGIPRYLSNDRIGKEGIETSYEDVLRGQMGIEQVLVDAFGRPVRAPEIRQEARDGDNLVLTIDAGLQQQVEQILRNWIEEGERRRTTQPDKFAYKRDYSPISSGVAIVIEVKTGRILAMVSWPGYDDNIWVDPTRSSELQELLNPPPDQLRELQRLAPLTNRAVVGQYPPGSTLKQFVALLALQDAIITPDTKLRDPGRLIVEDQYVQGRFYTYVNSSSRDNGMINVSDALKVSSNIFFMSIAGGNRAGVSNLKPEEQIIDRGLNIDRLANGLELFGFGQRSGVRMAGEAPGRVPTPAWKQQAMRSAWTTGDTYNAAIGQGNLEVTPLQLVVAGAAVANGGYLFRPQIVRGVQDAETGLIREVAPELVRRIDIDPQHFDVVREGMRRSVTEGLNVAARDECSGLSIAGKTGTAEFGPEIEIPAPDGKGTVLVRQSHSWFVGFAPYNDPQIEVLVLSEGTGDLNDGSATIAVPAVTQIMQAYFGVTPPNPLPRGCQQNMPPLPPRLAPEQLIRLSYEISDPRDRR